MDNLSKISTHIWRKARSNIMAPHHAEAEAVRTMCDLYTWGEIVVKGIDGYEVGEDEGIEDMTYGGAAKSLCGWLESTGLWESCEEIVRELEELAREGAGGNDDGIK
jgi:hypothetical protein